VKHAVLAPSSSARWGKVGGCTGSVTFSLAFPETEPSEHAAEGTAAHYAAEMLVCGKPIPATDPDGTIISEGMIEAANMIANDVLAVADATGASIEIEKRLDIPSVHPQCFGTVDYFVYDPRGQDLYVWDFKYGFGIVDVFENTQMICYASGIMDMLGLDGIGDQNLTVHLRIVQPRPFHRDGPIREWVVNGAALRPHINTLRNGAMEAMGAYPKIQTGRHCKNCPGRHACPAAISAGYDLFEVAMESLPVSLPVDSLAAQYGIVKRARQALDDLKSGYEEQIKSMIRSGKSVPGYTLEPGKGRETWKAPIDEVIAAGEMLGVDVSKPGVLTPAQARKKGMDTNVVSAYSDVPVRGMKLVETSCDKARQIFGG